MADHLGGGTLATGAKLGGTYELLSRIGRGGMGTVWMARHLRIPKRVAVKVLRTSVEEDSVAFARFRREAEVASRLGHPNIVEILDFDVHEDTGAPYIVMELLEGESLGALVSRGPVPLDRTREVVRQVALALSAAHREGVVHRDLKPENVMLVPREPGAGGPADYVKVLDFGISKILGSQSIRTRTDATLGTPQYMAPEQATGDVEKVGPATDQFALAAVAYEMLCGAPVFEGLHAAAIVYQIVHGGPAAPLSSRVPGIPSDVVAAVERGLEKDPDARFPTISAFVEAFCGGPLPADSFADEAEIGAVEDSGELGLATTLASRTRPGPRRADGAPGGGQAAARGRRRAAAVAGALAVAALVALQLPFGGRVDELSDPRLSHVVEHRLPSAEARSPARAPDVGTPLATAERRRGQEPPAAALRRGVDEERGRPSDERPPERPAKSDALPAAVSADLEEAAKQLAAGAYDRAIHLARRANRTKSTGTAASIIVRAYCGRRDHGNARSWLFAVPRAARPTVIDFCDRKGIDLR